MVISKQFKALFSLFLWSVVLATAYASTEVAENLTEADNGEEDGAEFRQGGIAQQLMPSYPAMAGVYSASNGGGYQYAAGGNTAGASGTGSGYVNMLRNLYRPPSLGLTDKVRHWVKSFMNRRQYVKPYYNPAIGGIAYAPSEYGSKPVFAANGYKAISVPLRQLQKYYKPYYGTEGASAAAAAGQYAGVAGSPGSASASSFYSPNGVASNGGLYASESASASQFSGGNSGLYGSPSDGSSGLFGGSGGAFSSGSPSSGLFSQGAGSSNIFNAPGGSSGIFGQSGDLSSYGGSLYGASGSPSSGLYHGSNAGSYSVDASSYGGQEGSSQYFPSSSSDGGYGSSAAASSILASLNGGSSNGGSSYGDLFASGANPAPSLYNPSGNNQRQYNANKKSSNYGASNTALYMSSDERNSESYPKPAQENSFTVDSSSGNGQAGASYSFSVQPAQSKSYSSAAFENAGFQPVAYSPEASGNAPSFQEKSSSS
ncbi:hypothetical protein JTE90_013889 [Oedothorax gibbosus]|uniref:Uncharacterized protein n=1 Tax=Oedothorax gibbosus TaxID=931172 RepID=A0AAV6VFP0_9ARAC|nr:hypothetical protein JTE90_013889 [Oedothorax gibbosus]